MKLQGRESVIHELRPEPGILAIWFFTKCLPVTVVGTFATFICCCILTAVFFTEEENLMFRIAIVATVVAAASLLVLSYVYCVFLRRTHVYYVTNRRCIFQGGILRRIRRSVPYHKVTDVETSQNIVERALGIAQLRIYTPGTGGQRAEISYVGLVDAETPAATINKILKDFKATGE